MNTHRTYCRREFLAAAGGVAASAALAGCGSTSVVSSSSAGSSSGGAVASSITWATNEAYSRPKMINPFEQASGINLNIEVFSDPNTIIAKLKTGGAGIAGFVDGSYGAQLAYEAGVIQPIDLTNVPNYQTSLIPELRHAPGLDFAGKPYGVPSDWGTDSMAYNHDKLSENLTDLSALFDPEFKGKIGMPTGLLESVIVGGIYAGVPDPFAMNADELAHVKQILIKQKPLVRTYWSDIGALTNLFATGEVYLAWSWVPVLNLRQTAGIDMVWVNPKEGQLSWYDANYVTTEASATEKRAFEDLMNYTLGDTYGVELAEEVNYRTTSLKAIANVPAARAAQLSLNNPEQYLKGSHFWVLPANNRAYEAVWNDVLNA